MTKPILDHFGSNRIIYDHFNKLGTIYLAKILISCHSSLFYSYVLRFQF